MTSLIDAAIARRHEELAAVQAAQAAAAAVAIQTKIEAEHAFIRAWLEQQPLWAELASPRRRSRDQGQPARPHRRRW